MKYLPLAALCVFLAGCSSSTSTTTSTPAATSTAPTTPVATTTAAPAAPSRADNEARALAYFNAEAERRFGGHAIAHPDKDAIEVFCEQTSAHHFDCSTLIVRSDGKIPLVTGTAVEHGGAFTVIQHAS